MSIALLAAILCVLVFGREWFATGLSDMLKLIFAFIVAVAVMYLIATVTIGIPSH